MFAGASFQDEKIFYDLNLIFHVNGKNDLIPLELDQVWRPLTCQAIRLYPSIYVDSNLSGSVAQFNARAADINPICKRSPCNYNVITMKTELIRIGNSRGIRIPKPLIEQCGLRDAVELRVENERIIISPGRMPRDGWKEQFQAAGSSAHDELLLETGASEFDRKEWQW